MTKEEYLQATSYASVEEARKDLKAIQFLFPAVLGAAFLVRIGAVVDPRVGIVSWALYLAFLVFFIWKCRTIIKKTRHVSKAQLLFSIVFAPLSWIWFYPQLSEPLEIIVGSRMPPTTDAVTEGKTREEARKKGSRNAWKTILYVAIAVLVFGVIAKMFGR